MSNSINTNIAAFYAQANITTASNAATANVARLSSGNAIVAASDNVAALAVGTSLGSQVSSLQTAQGNASQGTSLLQVADGSLAQILSILQQQSSLANQAQSGSLTNTDRGFLNQQFQTLTNEIDSLAGGTTFNGVSLIDGSIAQAGTVGSTNPLVNESSDAITPAELASALGSTTTAAAYGPSSGNGAINYTGLSAGTYLTAAITPPAALNGGNDAALYGALDGGVITVAANGTVDPTGNTPGATAYTIDYKINGVTYEGSLAMSPTGNGVSTGGGVDGSVAAGTQVVLQATADPSDHAAITLTVGTNGISTAADDSTAIHTDITAIFAGATGYTGAFLGGSDVGKTAITAPTASSSTYDTALYGDLSKGAFTVQAATEVAHVITGGATLGTDGTATGYEINYTLNGVTYQGFLTTTGNSVNGSGTAGGAAGVGTVTAGTAVTLSAIDGPTDHATITLTTGTHAFGVVTSVDQSDNLQAALTTNFQNATVLSTNASAVISGTTATGGITAVSATNNPTANDTALVGDLSKGTFNVSGSNAAGFQVSYTTAGGSTYQGSLTSAQATAGHTLVLSNGSGSLAFTIGAAAAATASTAAVFQQDLATFFTSTSDNVTTGATAYATHTVATTLAKDSSGTAIAGSAITAASTSGTLLNTFTGADATLQSSAYTSGATNMPPIATFSAAGTGTSTVLSVLIDGVTYSTGTNSVDGAGSNPVFTDGTDELKTATFDTGSQTQGSAGFVTFFANGDDTSDNKLVLNLSGISATANLKTAGDVANLTDALNTAFGSGGSTGGLTFQLGTTTDSEVTVNINSAKSTALFGGVAQDISTATGAGTAATATATAINTVTAMRAGVGALESQFNFASAALQTSVQNQSAAESSLLDTNIATESTAYATNQVKLQAGISVWAQPTPPTQALLKLIG